MYIFKIIILFFCFIFINCGGGGSSIDIKNNSQVSIEFNGDSLMYGEGIALNIPKYIKSTNPQWTIDDRGISGLTMKLLDIGYSEPYLNANKSLYPRGPQLSFSNVEHNSNIIIIELGANDAYIQSLTINEPSEFSMHLTSIVNYILYHNKIPVLVLIPQFSTDGIFNEDTKKYSELNNAIIRKIALEKNLDIVELDKVPFNISDTIDGVHRTQIASNMFADMIIIKIKNILDR